MTCPLSSYAQHLSSMQTLLQRFQGHLFPFTCPFIVAPASVQPQSKIIARPPLDLPLEIWLEIFQFATYVHRNATIKPLDPFAPRRITTNALGANTPSLVMRTKLALVLVSRSWRNVALQMLYENIVIRSPGRANAILATLESSRLPRSTSYEVANAHTFGYGNWTRHIEVYTFARGSGEISYLQTICKIIKYSPNLRILSGNWLHPLPVAFLDAISFLLGSSLLGLYWNDMDANFLSKSRTIATPEFLGKFQSLRILDLRHFVGSDPSSWIGCSSTSELPQVQDLILSTHPTSLQIAAHLALPSLRNLALRTPIWGEKNEEFLNYFLKTHGKSLVSVDITIPSPDSELDPDSAIQGRIASHVCTDVFLRPGICPHLETLTFPVTSPSIAPYTHPSLRRIGLRGGNMDGLYPNKVSSMRDHLMAINVDKYPKLELIQIVGFLVEAHTDSLLKDIFIWWVEHFKEMGVDFLDGEGVLWAYGDPLPGFKTHHTEDKYSETQPRAKLEAMITDRHISR